MAEDRAISLISLERQQKWLDYLFNPTKLIGSPKLIIGTGEEEIEADPLNFLSFMPNQNIKGYKFTYDNSRHLSVEEIDSLIKWNGYAIFALESKITQGYVSDPKIVAAIVATGAFLKTAQKFLVFYKINRENIIQKQEKYAKLIETIIEAGKKDNNIEDIANIVNDNFDSIIEDLNKVIALDPEGEEAMEAKKNLDNLVRIREDVLEIKENVDNLDWDDKDVVDDLLDIGKDFVGAVDRNVGTVELNENLKEKIKDVEDLKQEYDENFG